MWGTHENALADPILVKLPEVVLRHAVVIALQCGAFFACEIMIQCRLLERAAEYHGPVACHLLDSTIIWFLAMIAETISQRC